MRSCRTSRASSARRSAPRLWHAPPWPGAGGRVSGSPAEGAAHVRVLELALLEDVCGRVPLDDETLGELLVQPEDGSLRARRRVHADAFLGRLVEALEADFPAVRRILGG